MKYFYLFRSVFIFSLLFLFSTNEVQGQNAGDPDTTIGLGLFNGDITDIKEQADGKTIVGGNFTYYKNIAINRLIRFNADGSLDKTFNIGFGANAQVLSIAIQDDGKILIGGSFTSFNGVAINCLVRLNIDGSIDNTLNIGTGPNVGVFGGVFSIEIQTDGKIILGGDFTSFNGVAKNRLVRLNSNGTVDATFNVGTGATGIISAIAEQTDGKIIIGGAFSSYNGSSIRGIVRLNIDGSIDNSFNVGVGVNTTGNVYSVAILSDGKILIGGSFLALNSVGINRIARLNIDGSTDNTFNPNPGPNGGPSDRIFKIGIQLDGKVLIGGEFYSYNGIGRGKIARLNTDGTLDGTFDPGTGITYAGHENPLLLAIAIKSDGSIVLGGAFKSYNDFLVNNLAYLNSDGSLNKKNILGASNGYGNHVRKIVIQSDGKILIGGSFLNFNNTNKNNLVRLNSNGSVDNTFTATASLSHAESILIQTDSKILIAGNINNGNTVSGLIRLNSDGSIDNSFISTGLNGPMALQADGKILVGGSLANNNLERLNSDGSIDNSFNIGTGPNNVISSISVQPDGKIIIGGNFNSFNGIAANSLARINPDGSFDYSFNVGSGANFIRTIVLQDDGKILIGGSFSTFNGFVKKNLVRLNPNGSIDNSFNIDAGAQIISMYSIILQTDNKILLGGSFDINGNLNFVRLNPNGSTDISFNTGTGIDNDVYTIALQVDGKILIGGRFSTYQNIAYNRVVRLNGDPVYYNRIIGNIYADANQDCDLQITENPIPSVVVKALPGPYYGGSDAYGKYQVRVDSGTVNYTLTQEYNSINSKLMVNQCATSHNVSLKGASKDTFSFDFADSIKQYSLLNINVQKSRMRRCFRSNTYVNYCNFGNAAASGAQIRVVYPSYINPISSVPMWSSRQDSVLIYDVGTISKDFCGSINIIDSVICGNESIRGLTQCIKATISPATNCIAENPSWDRSSMVVSGSCISGGAHFVIKNDGSGNMADSLEYRVYVNDTLIFSANYKLKSGESLPVDYPAAGQTIRLEADQQLFHPGTSRPRVTIEGCGVGIPITGLVITTPQDDLDEEVAITCNTIRDSYDPNDKLAMPTGIGATNMVAPGTELEYTIRFQNTGTDTAYTVRVVDTLDVNLDVASFTQGASSHPYTLGISGKGQAVLAFNFYNINLPDSTHNKLGSNGLVSFRITVPSNTTLGTQIKNKAHIFFDYNSPIITNETMHTVDNTVAEDLSKGSLVQVGQVISGVNKGLNRLSVKIYPNPSAGLITIEIPDSKNNSEMRIISITGVLQKSVKLNNSSVQQVNLEGISQGMYLYEIWEEGERKAGGMLQMK